MQTDVRDSPMLETATSKMACVGIGHRVERGSLVRACFRLSPVRRDRRSRGCSGRDRNRISAGGAFARRGSDNAYRAGNSHQLWVERGLGSRAPRPGPDTALTFRSDEPYLRRSIPQTRTAARQSAGQERAERCDRIWRPASGQHRKFRRRRQPGRDRIAAMGLGNGPLERRDGAYPRTSRRCFLDGIIEGPSKWAVRPVAEVFYENEFGKAETISGLVGLIWKVSNDLSFDVGLRHALTNGHPVNEIRAGLTFGFPLRMFGDQSQQAGSF